MLMHKTIRNFFFKELNVCICFSIACKCIILCSVYKVIFIQLKIIYGILLRQLKIKYSKNQLK